MIMSAEDSTNNECVDYHTILPIHAHIIHSYTILDSTILVIIADIPTHTNILYYRENKMSCYIMKARLADWGQTTKKKHHIKKF